MDNDNELKRDIQRARAYLRTRFPESVPNSLMQSGYALHFPDPDRARVVPTIYEHEVDTGAASYRLTWTKRGLVWEAEGMEVRRLFGLPNICASIPVPEEE